jgi:acyl-CoA thioesterase FadM
MHSEVHVTDAGLTAGKGNERPAFTAYLNVKFKKPLHTPHVVMVRGQVKKVEGRKLFVKGSCEDMNGIPFAEADGLWVLVGPKKDQDSMSGKM